MKRHIKLSMKSGILGKQKCKNCGHEFFPEDVIDLNE